MALSITDAQISLDQVSQVSAPYVKFPRNNTAIGLHLGGRLSQESRGQAPPPPRAGETAFSEALFPPRATPTPQHLILSALGYVYLAQSLPVCNEACSRVCLPRTRPLPPSPPLPKSVFVSFPSLDLLPTLQVPCGSQSLWFRH